jgi:uncharacterized membrane protein
MSDALLIAGLWVAFAATHMALSSVRLRPRLVAVLGERGFAGAYSLIALGIFVPLVSIYFANKHAGPFLWYLGDGILVRGVQYVGMGAALALVVAGLARPSPASLVPGRAEVTGAFRIARHPTFAGIGIFGLAHLFGARVNATELAFFAGFPIFAALGSWHQDRRKCATLGEKYARFVAGTPFVPFTGPGLLLGIRESAVPMAVGVALAVALRTWHGAMFG